MVHRGVSIALVAALLLAPLVATVPAAAAPQPPPDPPHDVIGWVNGYWYNQSISVDQRDGLSPAERTAFVSRAEARIEVLTHRQFNRTVPVRVIDRASYGNTTAGNASPAYDAWNNQVWEALFIVGENQDVQQAIHSTTTAQTTGAYFYATHDIRIITDTPAHPTIDRGTLVHELVHAQQDQYYNLSSPTYNPVTQDGQLANDGLLEGEANYVRDLYQSRCGSEWSCVSNAGGGGPGGSGDINLGIYLTVFNPYSDGPPYVDSLVQRGGWPAVYAKFQHPPNASSQIIHHTDRPPAPLSLTDEATGGWRPFPTMGRNGTDTAGEASIFSMFFYQASRYQARTGVYSLGDPSTLGPYDTYDYSAPPSAGWGDDAILPYHRNTSTGPEYGYVWATTWETPTDARQFAEAYHAILRAHDARSVGPDTWVIDTGPYADAFRVVRDGRNVTIVNGPRVSSLAEIRPSLAPAVPTPTSATPRPSATPQPTTATPTEGHEPTSTGGQPGFGVALAIFGLAAAALAASRRRH